MYFLKRLIRLLYFAAYFLYVATAMSVTAGAHRLWAHKTYKANLPLRLILLWFFTMAFQVIVYLAITSLDHMGASSLNKPSEEKCIWYRRPYQHMLCNIEYIRVQTAKQINRSDKVLSII